MSSNADHVAAREALEVLAIELRKMKFKRPASRPDTADRIVSRHLEAISRVITAHSTITLPDSWHKED